MSEKAPRTWTGPNLTGKVQVNMLSTTGQRLLAITRIDDLTPDYRRIHLSGAALDNGFPFANLAISDHVKVVFPQPGSKEVTIPKRGERGWDLPEGAPKPIIRDYTVRGWLPDTKELILDFVVHDHGIAGKWARNASAGDQLVVMGPRGNVIFPENYARYILFGDETALPSIGRFIEELPAGPTVQVFALVENDSGKQNLGERENMNITWLNRSTEGPGSLERAARAAALPEGEDWYVFAAGEVGELKPIRDYFRSELQLPKDRVMISGYWQRGMDDFDHHNTGIED